MSIPGNKFYIKEIADIKIPQVPISRSEQIKVMVKTLEKAGMKDKVQEVLMVDIKERLQKRMKASSTSITLDSKQD
jgi:hypothetical protein